MRESVLSLTATGSASPLLSGEQDPSTYHDLVVTYGAKRAVDGLMFKVRRGSIFGFLAPNGSGKTAAIKTLLGFRPPMGQRGGVRL